MNQMDKAESFVTKRFLIDIITRDIGILDAILELVDNSLDRAIEKYRIDVTKSLIEDYNYTNDTHLEEPLTVNLHISEDEFIIEDNCGGITKEDLEHEVFVFGLPKEGIEYIGLSAFGIGMKRAFFKLGKLVEFRTRTEQDDSTITWNIDEWMNLDDWNIPFSKIEDTGLHFTYNLPGTIIKIRNLKLPVRTRFNQKEFLSALKNRLRTSYALFLKSGIIIKLNEEDVTHSLPSIFKSEEITYTSKYIKKGDVDIRLIAGITPVDDRIPRGWYVFCNGRMVLEADKTQLTGWGTSYPMFHPKFNHFLGYVSFSSSDVKALPWSSTKWGVELDSQVYNAALEEMRLQAIPILDLLDRWKDAKEDDEPALPALRDLLIEGQTIPIFASAKDETSFTYKPKKERPDVIRISFVKESELVQKVKDALGNPKMKNSAVGELVFDYFVESELN